MTAVGYEDLVAAATVGLSQSPLQVTALDGPAAGHEAVLARDDQAAALLDAAALLTAARRAGVLAAAGVTAPPPAATDTAAELPAGAARLLRRGGSGELLADLLTEAARRGYCAPAPMLPFLLDLAVKDTALRPAVVAVLGARGRWLARYQPDWHRVAGAGVPETLDTLDAAAAPGAGQADDPGAGQADDPGEPGAWETGTRSERLACLAALRRSDPAAARELLAAGWARETGDDRECLIAVLAEGLSAADEEFLEQVLGDRKDSVRAAARRLLAALPGSAFSSRAAVRAARLLRLEQQPRARLIASLPDCPDPAAIRDGISASLPGVLGAPAWLLTQMIAAAPLDGWVTAFGMDPGQIVSLPVAADPDTGAGQTGSPAETEDLHSAVHAGWRLAAVGQARSQWAAALLAARESLRLRRRMAQAWPPDYDLAAVLPAAARVTRAIAVLADPRASQNAAAEVASCAQPWPEPLADAVIAALRHIVVSTAKSASVGYRYGSSAELVNAAARGLPAAASTDYAALMTQLAGAENCPPYWSSALRSAAGTIAVRRAFLEEIR